MKSHKYSFSGLAGKDPQEVLETFIRLFAQKGWLNQTLRIQHRDRRYRIGCSEKKFFAYRINDQFGLYWGFPGWLVCMVTPEEVLAGSEGGPLDSTELGLEDWFRCLEEGDFEIL